MAAGPIRLEWLPNNSTSTWSRFQNTALVPDLLDRSARPSSAGLEHLEAELKVFTNC
jgi:hypothetical protein